MNTTKLPNLIPYACPEWAKTLKAIPTYRLKLANPDTPIQEWNLPNIPKGFSVSIKRDDMTGSTTLGNKVRKLEFLLADALSRGCRHVITCGGLQSNHCSATTVASRQLGLKPHLLLRSDIQNVEACGSEGNLLLNRLCGADIYLVPRKSPYSTKLKPRMEALAQTIKEKTGEDSYHIPVGGSNKVGLFGYITVFEELLSQNIQEKFDDLVFACGSGGTAAGLSIANFLTGSKLRIHPIVVSDDEKYFLDHINTMLREVNLADRTKAEDIVDIIEGHKGQGYGISTEEELEFIFDVSQQTGIMLDPVYSGKAAKGLMKELNNNPSRFLGNRILFLHTGGIFGMFDGRLGRMVKPKTDPLVKMWQSVEEGPP